VVARLRASITSEEFALRLRRVGLSQRVFALRCGFSVQLVSTYCRFERPSATAYRLLVLEEMLARANALIAPPKVRVPRRAMRRVLDAANVPLTDEPITRSKVKRVRKPGKRNLLSPRFLPRVPPSDEFEMPETWRSLAERIGQAEAKRLHERLASQRPPAPRHNPADDGGPKVRTTGPI
jgi:hypothetical protein